MAKKIENIARSGLPGKIYYLCFSQPRSIYEVSKMIYGKAQPQKLYVWKDKLLEKGYLKTVDGKFISATKPIIEEINNRLKEEGKSLENGYAQYLDEWIDEFFRDYRIKFGEDIKITFEEDIKNVSDGLETIITDLDLFLILYNRVIVTYLCKNLPEFRVKNLFEYNRLLPKITPERAKKTSEDLQKSMQYDYGISATINPEQMKYIFIPEDLLDLLSTHISFVGKTYDRFAVAMNKMQEAMDGALKRSPGLRRKGFRR